MTINASRRLASQALALAGLGLWSLVGRARSDGFPSKPLKIIVPVTPGSGIDAASRFFGRQLELALGQPVVVENLAGGNGLVAIAETEVSSGVAALVCATMPLWMAVFAAMAGERPSRREGLGIAIGLAAVVLLVGGAELAASPRAAMILVGSPLAWALGSVLAKRLPVPTGLAAPGTQMLTGGVCLIIAALVRGESVPTSPSAASIGAWVYLLVLGSLVAFTAYSWLLRNARPAVATSYAFVNPVLAVLLGVVLAGEELTRATVLAAPLVVVAVVLVIGGRTKVIAK